MKGYFIIGAGGHSKVVIDTIESCGDKVLGVFDMNSITKEILGYPIQLLASQTFSEDDSIIIAIGNNTIRRRVVREISLGNYGKIIHSSSWISNRAMICPGTIVMAGVTINAQTKIGRHCIINTNASVDHDCEIDNFVHISPNAALCGNVVVGEGTHLGAGAVVVPGMKIGKWVTIGAGSVIINDIPDYSTVVGNPGRIIKINKDGK